MSVKKMTRMDKVHLKEELNFKNQINPLITIYSKINRKIEHTLLGYAMYAICAF